MQRALHARFASAKLRFGCFDVLDWPRAAADMKMTTNTWSSQLPAVVLYEKGREWGRLPPEESANDPTKRNNYTRVRPGRHGTTFNHAGFLCLSGCRKHRSQHGPGHTAL